jgi:hypothetical protein
LKRTEDLILAAISPFSGLRSTSPEFIPGAGEGDERYVSNILLEGVLTLVPLVDFALLAPTSSPGRVSNEARELAELMPN